MRTLEDFLSEFFYDLDIKESSIESILWKKSEELLCKKRSSDFIQAYMDIGSLICIEHLTLNVHCVLRMKIV